MKNLTLYKQPKPVVYAHEIASMLMLHTSHYDQGLQDQETSVETGQAPIESVRVAETAPALPTEISASKDSTITGHMMPQITFGQYHALVIGNNNYLHEPKLQAAVSDAQAISALLQKDYGFSVKLLLNATREEVMGSLYDLRGQDRKSTRLNSSH